MSAALSAREAALAQLFGFAPLEARLVAALPPDGRAISPRGLMARLYPDPEARPKTAKVLHVTLHKIRRKAPGLDIRTVRGQGYRLASSIPDLPADSRGGGDA